MGSFLSFDGTGQRGTGAVYTPPKRDVVPATSPQETVDNRAVSHETGSSDAVLAVIRRNATRAARLSTITTSERGVLNASGVSSQPQRKILLGE